eukprot:12156471-Alexandrium_andersonii.AAC.1
MLALRCASRLALHTVAGVSAPWSVLQCAFGACGLGHVCVCVCVCVCACGWVLRMLKWVGMGERPHWFTSALVVRVIVGVCALSWAQAAGKAEDFQKGNAFMCPFRCMFGVACTLIWVATGWR